MFPFALGFWIPSHIHFVYCFIFSLLYFRWYLPWILNNLPVYLTGSVLLLKSTLRDHSVPDTCESHLLFMSLPTDAWANQQVSKCPGTARQVIDPALSIRWLRPVGPKPLDHCHLNSLQCHGESAWEIQYAEMNNLKSIYILIIAYFL